MMDYALTTRHLIERGRGKGGDIEKKKICFLPRRYAEKREESPYIIERSDNKIRSHIPRIIRPVR